MGVDALKYIVEGSVASIVIDRPDAMNALTFSLLGELEAAVRRAAADPVVRAVVIRGAGEKAFAAGADIKELVGRKGTVARRGMEYGQAVFTALERMGKPSIAAVNGYALGGGFELALACTFRIASRTARFGLPEVKLGLIPGYGGTQRLPAIVGVPRAAELILTGRTITADEALSWGLVNRVVEPHELDAESRGMAAEVTKYGPVAAEMALDAIYAGAGVRGEGLLREAANGSLAYDSEDGQEGLLAFIGKRQPRFAGK